jgi:MarR family transcriptional regulator, temperature-dependent positive regulator of motility
MPDFQLKSMTAPMSAVTEVIMKAHAQPGRLDGSVLHLLHRAGQHAEGIFIEESPEDALTPRQYAILLAVDTTPDISQTALVGETGIDRSTLADVVARLVTKGLLLRKRTRADARTNALKLSPKGRDALEAVHPSALRADERILAALNPQQRAVLIEALQQIVQSLKAEPGATDE